MDFIPNLFKAAEKAGTINNKSFCFADLIGCRNIKDQPCFKHFALDAQSCSTLPPYWPWKKFWYMMKRLKSFYLLFSTDEIAQDVSMPLDVEAKKLKIWSWRNVVKIPEEVNWIISYECLNGILYPINSKHKNCWAESISTNDN